MGVGGVGMVGGGGCLNEHMGLDAIVRRRCLDPAAGSDEGFGCDIVK